MISVIIPTYNRGSLIRRSIDSILNQTYEDIEVVVVDDNSTDDTEDIINEIIDRRIKYFKLNENKGACFARNKGVELSKGEYVAFQDSDDEWNVEKLSKQLNYLERNNLDIVSCRVCCIQNNNKNIFPKDTYISIEKIYYKNSIGTQTILGKKTCFLEERFNEKLSRFQDWDLAIRLLRKYKIEILNDVLVKVYMQNDSISKNPQKAIKSLEQFLQFHGKNKKIMGYYNRLIGLYKMQDNNENYKEYFNKAFCLNPFNKEILFDFILCKFGLNKFHYKFYLKRGRFK
jgi:glycosyltransferase involved in cell wall biosynthesis